MEKSGQYYSKETRLRDNDNFYLRTDLLGKCSIEAIIALAIIEDEGIMSNKSLAVILDVNPTTASKYLNELRKLNLLETKISQEAILGKLKIEPKKLICEWCDMKVSLLEEHHYPVPERNGGIETVSICPNCHKMFQKIETYHNGGMQSE